MAASGVSSLSLVPNLTPLKKSRSIVKSLIWPQLSPSSGTQCLAQLPVASHTKTVGDDCCLDHWTSRLSWFICLVLVTLVTVFILGTHPLFNNRLNSSKVLSFYSNAFPSSSPHRSDEHPSVEFNSSQDSRFRGEKVDEKCWSRTRHWMFRPSTRRFPPSASLTRALDEYERLHARCTAGKKWESFEELTKTGSNQDSCKYLLYIEGPQGLGNRFLSLVSAFTYALITDRVLLLDSRRNMSGLICEPFQGSSWNLPTSFPFGKVDELPSLSAISDVGELGKMAAVRLNLSYVQSEQDKQFFCSDVQERLRNVTLLSWQSDQYYLPRLYTILPEYWEKLNTIFDNPSLVFTQLSRVLLLPNNAVWARTEGFYRAYLASSRKLVGIQVRTPEISSFEQPIQDRMVQCLTSHQILPKLREQPLDFSAVTTMVPEEGTAILVASLQREYYEHLMELYAERGAEDGSLVTVHTMAALGQENDSHDQAVAAFVDMLLLSFSDSLATSGHSTFGYVAQSFGAIIPHIVNTNKDQPESCDIGQSFEPCTHDPFPDSCPATRMNVTFDQGEWIKKHIRPCQDRPWGIQLV